MSSVIEKLERAQLRRLPDFQPGDRVKFHVQVVEGNRKRTQVFEGVVIARQGNGVRETATVRKQSFGVGVERTFPLHSPKVEKIEVAARGDVRRAKLYYLRDRIGRKSRVRERTDLGPEEAVERELLEAPIEAAVEPDSDVGADGSDEAVIGESGAGVDEGIEEPAAEEPAAEEPAPEEPAAEEAPADEPAEEAPAEEPSAEEGSSEESADDSDAEQA